MAARWRAAVEKELKGAPFDSLVSTLPGPIRVEPLYEDRPEGEFGASPPRFILASIFADTAPMAEMRAWLADDVSGGADALLVDAEPCSDPRFPHLLDSLPAGRIALYASVGASVANAQALSRWADSRGHLVASHGLDPLGAYARDGAPEPGQIDWRGVASFVSAATSGRPLLASFEPYHDAGADPITELAYALATTAEMLRRLELPPEALASRLAWRFSIGREVLIETAKLRAARRLWRMVFAACGVAPDCPAHLVAVTSARTQSRRDPWVNAIRATTQCFAAIVGSASVIAARPYDSALGVPDAAARQLARNTLLVLRHESSLDEPDDPARGSYAVEHLTDLLARAAWDRFRRIEEDGGMVARLRAGTVKSELAAAWADWQSAVLDKRFPITGVTEFPDPRERPLSRNPRLTVSAADAQRPCPLPRHRDAESFERTRIGDDGAPVWEKS